MAEEKVLEMKNISKSYMGVHALKNVNFTAYKNKVNVIMGENGAGKSTLMKILAGAIEKDEGEILIEAKTVDIHDPVSSMQNGISMIYQELNNIRDLPVYENLFLGREITNFGTFVQKKEAIRQTQELLDKYQMDISATATVGDLSIAKQQMLEMVKALSKNAKIIVMDEPTSSLTLKETGHLFQIIRYLNDNGVTVIYISHRMEEVFEIGDYITVLRDGELIKEIPIGQINQDELITLMVGREIKHLYPKEKVDYGETVLRVANLTKQGVFENISFELKRGEILGFSGLVGAGRTEVALSIFGAMSITSGEVEVNGKKIRTKTPYQAMKKKIAYLPEDRKIFGLCLDARIRNNISTTNMDKVTKLGFLDFKKEWDFCSDAVDKLSIKTPSINQLVANLSGGNQQKVSLAKWITRDVDVLILDEPTRGVDIGAKEEIHKLIIEIAKKQIGIILISSELPEVLGMSDRIIVMHEGKQKAILDRSEATQEKILSYSIGVEM